MTFAEGTPTVIASGLGSLAATGTVVGAGVGAG